MGWLRRLGVFTAAVVCFVVSLQVMTSATETVASTLRSFLEIFVRGDFSAMGGSWLMTYVLFNGSSVAAVSLAFMNTGLFTATETFMAVSGSRIGASFTVVLIGVLEYLRGRNQSIIDSCSVGLLSFIISYLVYVPAVALGYFLVAGGPELHLLTLPGIFTQFSGGGFTGFFTDRLLSVAGNLVSFVLAVLGLYFSLELFDKAFSNIGDEFFRSRYFRFLMEKRWVSFAAGAALTLVTTSVSVSLGVVVPLYNTGYIRRQDLVPYIVGANITTLADTLGAALVIGSSEAVGVVLVLMLTVILVSLGAMLFYSKFYRVVKYLFDRMVEDRAFLYFFTFTMFALPLLLLLMTSP